MSEKKPIRIIKKGKDTCAASKPKGEPGREVARVMVGTITNWVTEFQQRRRAETTDALRVLQLELFRKNQV
jgi:hypothetical protein